MIPSTRYTLSTLITYDMEWCYCILYEMRNRLAQVYIKSIENKRSCSYRNCMDINVFCNELVSMGRIAEQQFNRKINWKYLVLFCERFSCIEQDDPSSDIRYKHWKINDIQYMNVGEYVKEVFRNDNSI
eukprot:132253_1